MRCSNKHSVYSRPGVGGIQNNDTNFSSSQQAFACFHKHSSHIRPLLSKNDSSDKIFSLSALLCLPDDFCTFFCQTNSLSFHYNSPSCLSLSGGEQDLISSCRIKCRPLCAGSRWWKIRLFGPASSWMQRVCLSAREHQITLNPGSLTPLILNGRLI